MKIKINEKRDMIDQDGDGMDDRLKPEFSEFEIESIKNGKVMAKLLAHVLDELKVLAHTMTPAKTLGKSSSELASAQLSVAEENLGENKERKFEWSPIRRSDSSMVFKSSKPTHVIAGGHIRLPFAADTQWTMSLTKNTQQNNIVIIIPQDGIDLEGKRYTTSIKKNINAKFLYIDPEGGYMDIPTWLVKKDGITDKYGNILDGQGKIIATKPQQKKLSNATIPWPKPGEKQRPAGGGIHSKKKWGPQKEHLKVIEDALVKYLLEIDSENKDS